MRLKQIKPKPHAVERADALPALGRFLAATPDVELVWLTDGVDLGGGGDFVAALGRLVEQRPVTVIEGGIAGARALASADNAAGALTVKVLRARPAAPPRAAPCARSTSRACRSATPPSRSRTASARPRPSSRCRSRSATTSRGWKSPASARPARWRCSTSAGAGARSASSPARPPTPRSRCLASTYYLGRALGPFADVRLAERGSPAQAVSQFIEQRLPMLILADVGNVAEARDRLARWVEEGGVLVRFAGPRLAAADDDLVPVKLRRGGRILGGSLSWEQPQQLSAFTRESPFFGMTGADRRHRQPPGAGRARRHADRAHLGDARRRHAAGHRASAAARA